MSVAVLRILEEFPDGEATIEQIKRRIPDYITLTDEDRQPSSTRSGEELWEQIVRNIVSHGNARAAGNILTEVLPSTSHEGNCVSPMPDAVT